MSRTIDQSVWGYTFTNDTDETALICTYIAPDHRMCLDISGGCASLGEAVEWAVEHAKTHDYTAEGGPTSG